MPLSLEKARIKPLQDKVVFPNLKPLAVGDFVQPSLVMFNGFLSLVNWGTFYIILEMKYRWLLSMLYFTTDESTQFFLRFKKKSPFKTHF